MVGCVKIKSNFKFRINLRVLLFVILPTIIQAMRTEQFDSLPELSLKKRNMLVNILVNKLFAYIRHIIAHGSPIIGIPVLDPFKMDDFHLIIPTGVINLDLRLTNISVIGFKGFILHRNILHLSNLTFDMEVSLSRVVIAADTIYISEIYTGNFISAIPILANKEKTELEMDNFRLQTTLQLKQSEDEKSILIDKIENLFWILPSCKVNSEGIIDKENFEILPDLEDLFVEYIESCKNTITTIITNALITFGNPILNRLDTWRYIAILL